MSALEKLRAIASEPQDTAKRIERDAASIARAMASIHGGDWRVQIDHQAGLVAIVQR